jgi:hypothetical protein
MFTVSRKSRHILLTLSCLLLLLSLALSTSTALAVTNFRVLTANLTGAAEVPGPGDPDGSGIAKIRLFPDSNLVCFSIRAEDITLPALAAHIHVGGADVAGPIVVTLAPPDASGSVKGCATADEALIRAIYNDPSAYYVNVHTTDYPGGAIRGQLSK